MSDRITALEERVAELERLIELVPAVKATLKHRALVERAQRLAKIPQIADREERGAAFLALDDGGRRQLLTILGAGQAEFLRGLPKSARDAALASAELHRRRRLYFDLVPLDRLEPLVKVRAVTNAAGVTFLSTRSIALTPEQTETLLAGGWTRRELHGGSRYPGFQNPGLFCIEPKRKWEARLVVDEDLRKNIASGMLAVEELPERALRDYYREQARYDLTEPPPLPEEL